jgi:hypothetical protein
MSALWDYTLCVGLGIALGLPWELALVGPVILHLTAEG